eukprot:236402_1
MAHSEPISSYIKFIGYFVSFFLYAIFLLYNWCHVKKTNIDRNVIQIWIDKSNELHISTAGDVENQVTPLPQNDQGYLLNPSTIIDQQQQETKEEKEQHNEDNQYTKFEFEIKNALLRSNFAIARIIADLINSTVIIVYFNYFTGLQYTSIFGIIQLTIYCISMLFDLIDITIHLIPKTKQKIMENYVLTDSFNAKYYFIQFIHTYFNFFSLFFTIYLCHTTLSHFDTYWIITLSFTNKIKSILEIHWKSFQKIVFKYPKTHDTTSCDTIIFWLVKKLIYAFSELLLYIPLFLISSSIITCFVSTENKNIYFNGLLPIWFVICTFYSARKLLLYYKCHSCINNYFCTKINICFGFMLVSTLLACVQLGFILYCWHGKTYYYSYSSLFIFAFISLLSIVVCIQIPGACAFIINHLCLMCGILCAFVAAGTGTGQPLPEFKINQSNTVQTPEMLIAKIFQFILLLLTYFVLMPFIVIFSVWMYNEGINLIYVPILIIVLCAGGCGGCQFIRGLCICNDNDQFKGIVYVLMGVILVVFMFWFLWEFDIVYYTTK